MPVLYEELRRTARAYMRREREGNTLQTTALVNEAWLRLADVRQIQWHDRSHFFALAAQLMRRVLVDRARTNRTAKRGTGVPCLPLDGSMAITSGWQAELLDLDRALRGLEAFDARKAQVVEMRFFGGMGVDEIAEALGVSPNTVMRDWSISRVWLARKIRGETAVGASVGG